MNKIILLILLSVIHCCSVAQVTTPFLDCKGLTDGNFPFTAKFDGKVATVTFKGWAYTLPYTHGWVGSDGVRWSYYQNEELSVQTTYPFDWYVSIKTNPTGRFLSSSVCNKR